MSATSLTEAEARARYNGAYGYTGWSQAAADADFAATGGAGKGATGGSTLGAAAGGGDTSFIGNLLQQVQQMAAPGIEKGVSTLQGAIGDVNDRYNKLLDTFRNRAETTQTAEYGKRGVPISSTSAQQGIQQAGQQATASLEAQRGAEITPLQSAIASLQAGQGMGDVIGNALQYLQLQQQAQLQGKQLELANKQLDYDISNVGNTGGGGGGGGTGIIDWNSAWQNFNNQSPTLGSAQTTQQTISPAQTFQQRVQSGNVGQATVGGSGSSLLNNILYGLGLK